MSITYEMKIEFNVHKKYYQVALFEMILAKLLDHFRAADKQFISSEITTQKKTKKTTHDF